MHKTTMLELLLIVTSISFLDSISMIPLCIVPLTILFGGNRPQLSSLMFITGIVITYFPFGLLLLFGLDMIFDWLTTTMKEFLSKEPDTLDLVLQLVIDIVMVIFGYRITATRDSSVDESTTASITPRPAFMLGAVLNMTGMWGALPYFAAIDQILRADLDAVGMVLILAYYNLVFIVPLLAFIGLRYALGRKTDRPFQRMARFFTRWGRRLIVLILFGLGVILIVDGISWFMGMPLLPNVESQSISSCHF